MVSLQRAPPRWYVLYKFQVVPGPQYCVRVLHSWYSDAKSLLIFSPQAAPQQGRHHYQPKWWGKRDCLDWNIWSLPLNFLYLFVYLSFLQPTASPIPLQCTCLSTAFPTVSTHRSPHLRQALINAWYINTHLNMILATYHLQQSMTSPTTLPSPPQTSSPSSSPSKGPTVSPTPGTTECTGPCDRFTKKNECNSCGDPSICAWNGRNKACHDLAAARAKKQEQSRKINLNDAISTGTGMQSIEDNRAV